ncbi:glycosyltransferase family 61 protein [Cognatiyoonia sp. IB215182]|uniref:glycosyltransferase family 61 protein n=1 Tax=Cognatiyoonia sp. IB215182 TaxID=3097353 RepID=UPI002A1159F8|nr:glycosyltransferase family 61 protein [Cognatiyoonia sp. IB215182]MDX8353079.1 glycosyltransferase family 61 protein [Cognatiyoonia sp. IB215182]
MTLNWPMVERLGRRLLGQRPGHLRDLAQQTITLAPAETATVPPAIYPDDALDKITGLSPWRSWPVETALIEAGQTTHAATLAHVVEDVMIFGPFIYKGVTHYDPSYGDEKLWQSFEARRQEIDSAALVSCFSGSRFFGPFLKDSLPLELLTDQDTHAIAMPTRAYSHEAGYRALFDLPAPPVVEHAHVRRLTFYDDFGQNAGRGARYETLHQRLRDHLKPRDADAPAGIYLKRGQTGEARILSNETELEDLLRTRGFDIVEPASLTAEEIAQQTLDAPIVISVEGSHISHVAYSMARTGTLLVLQPPDRFAMAFKEFTDRVGIQFSFFVGDASDGGFHIDLDSFQQFLDRVMP